MRRLLLAFALILPATPAHAAPDTVVPIVYTCNETGLFSAGGSINEIRPLYDSDLRGEVRSEGLVIDFAVLRQGSSYLWAPEGGLQPHELAAAVRSGTLTAGSPRPLPGLRSDYSFVYQRPGEPTWLVGWLAEKLRDLGRTPDAALGEGLVSEVAWPGHAALQLVSADRTPLAAGRLGSLEGWQWALGLRTPARRGRKVSHLYAFGRRYGGAYLYSLGQRLAASEHALRVNAGNLVEGPNDVTAEISRAASLERIRAMHLDALVPFKTELGLPRAQLSALAAAAPLVAANLTPPDGIAARPYQLVIHGGVRIALVGLADTTTLGRAGLLGPRTGWLGEDPVKALKRTRKELEPEHPDAIVVITNLRGDRLVALREEAEQVAAIITPEEPRADWKLHERFESGEPLRTRNPGPRLVVGCSDPRVGLLKLGFRAATPAREGGFTPIDERPRQVLVWLENDVTVAHDQLPLDDPGQVFELEARMLDHLATHDTAVLPDIRQVGLLDKRLQDEDGEPNAQYLEPQWTMLAASCLRRAAGAEVAIIRQLKHGSNTIGEIPRYLAESWLPRSEELALVQVSGRQLRQLLTQDPDGERFSMAGVDRKTLTVGGRALSDGDRYRVITTLAVAMDETVQRMLAAPPDTELALVGDRLVATPGAPGLNLRDATLAQLDAMQTRTGGFTPGYLEELRDLLTDDGTSFEPRLSVRVRPLDGSFRQFSVNNRLPFGEVRNSLVNTPDHTSYGGKASVAVTYETAELDWENRVAAEYQRMELEAGGQHVSQEQADQAQLGTELRLKFIKLQLQRSALDLIPYVGLTHDSEFTPTVDGATGKENARRQELSGTLGVVLYPGSWLKEVRLGALGKNDLALAGGKFEPGVQLAGEVELPLGPFVAGVQADVKNYFLTPTDTAADLGLLAQVGAGLQYPLWSGLALRVGVDAVVFTGKVQSTRSLGTSWTPSLGLTFNSTWKPLVGIVQ